MFKPKAILAAAFLVGQSLTTSAQDQKQLSFTFLVDTKTCDLVLNGDNFAPLLRMEKDAFETNVKAAVQQMMDIIQKNESYRHCAHETVADIFLAIQNQPTRKIGNYISEDDFPSAGVVMSRVRKTLKAAFERAL